MRFLIIGFMGISLMQLNAQTTQEVVHSIYREALNDYTSYEQLRQLCKEAPGRLSGTEEIYKALDLTAEFLRLAGADTVFYQPLMAPNWKRGDKEICYVEFTDGKKQELTVCALGFSIGTGKQGVAAGIIEVTSFEELEKMQDNQVEGKMVFFNKPFDNALYNTFDGYGKTAGYRVYGAAEAAKKGAVAAIIRSATNEIDDHPHTGVMRYKEGIPEIPAVCISTLDANMLSKILRTHPSAEVFLRTTCKNLPQKKSYNVIADIKGSEHPEKIILVGGHIDTWFNGEGAHDDGAGCIQSIEVLRLFKTLGIQPKHTLRAVMFMDEEMSQTGGKAYAARVDSLNEFHLAAIESDRGAFTPLGFTIDADSAVITSIQQMKEPFTSYGCTCLKKGTAGWISTRLKNLVYR